MMWCVITTPVWAKDVSEAMHDMGDVEGTDPNGFKLMVFCISFLCVLAGTLIGVTTWYMLKGNKKRQ
jgi:hypothetical protein